jgi:hypothetical protein
MTFHHVLNYDGFYIGNDNIPLPELPWINIMMLMAQILVMAAGIASFVVNKKVLAFAPLAFCFTVIMLIQYVGIRLGGLLFERGYYQTGYYLTISSLPFYVIAFTVELVSSRRRKPIQETNPAMTETKNIDILGHNNRTQYQVFSNYLFFSQTF